MGFGDGHPRHIPLPGSIFSVAALKVLSLRLAGHGAAANRGDCLASVWTVSDAQNAMVSSGAPPARFIGCLADVECSLESGNSVS